MPRGADFRVEGAVQLAALSTQLREAGNKTLMKSLRKRLNAVTKPIVAEVRAAAKATPGKGDGSLRASLARSVQSKLSTSSKSASVSIKLSGARMPSGQRGLPALVEGLRPWRHPTFGHDPWKKQAPHPFFYQTLKKNEQKVQSEVARVLDDVTNEITK